MLASGVCRLWDTPRRKSSLAASSSTQLRVLGLHPREQLGVAHRDRDLEREQIEQVLVRPLPAPRRGQVADETPSASPPARSSARIGRDSPGTGILDRRRDAGSTSRTRRRSSRTRCARRRRGAAGSCSRPSRAGRVLDGDEDLAELAVASLEVGRQAVVAVGEAGELVVAGRRRSGVDRSPAETRSTARRDRAQRRGQVGREGIGDDRRTRPRWPAANRRSRADRRVGATGPGSNTSSTTMPNTASGSTAAATRAASAASGRRTASCRAGDLVGGPAPEPTAGGAAGDAAPRTATAGAVPVGRGSGRRSAGRRQPGDAVDADRADVWTATSR